MRLDRDIVHEFKQSTVVVAIDGKPIVKRKYSVNPENNPKQLYYEYSDHDGQMRKGAAIYKIDGNTLTIFANLVSEIPPEKFEKKAGPKQTLDIYKKVEQ